MEFVQKNNNSEIIWQGPFALYMLHSRNVFNLGTTDILDQIILCCEGLICALWMFSSLSGLYLLHRC